MRVFVVTRIELGCTRRELRLESGALLTLQMILNPTCPLPQRPLGARAVRR